MNIALITAARQKDILKLDRKQVAAGDADSLEAARIRAGHADAKITQEIYHRLPETATAREAAKALEKEVPRGGIEPPT